MNFDYWQRWGIDLDDQAFANAWAALGLNADRYPGAISVEGLLLTRWPSGPVTWTFPPRTPALYGRPREWAAAWREATTHMPMPPRLRIEDPPPDEPIRPWYRLLREAVPTPAAVSLRTEAPRAQFHFEWPLRMGAISNAAQTIIGRAQTLWPARKVTRLEPLEHGNCDLLVHEGPARTLVEQLLRRRRSFKANVVLLTGGSEADWGEIDGLLRAALSQTRASGFILVPASSPRLPEFLNGLVQGLTQAQPIDVALSNASRETSTGDVIAGFTDELATFVLPDLIDRFNARLTALPPGTLMDMSGVGRPDEWLARGVKGRGAHGGLPKAAVGASPDDDRRVPADSVSLERERLPMPIEPGASETVAEVSAAMSGAEPPPEAVRARAARFLQQRSFVHTRGEFASAQHGFVAGELAVVRVRIAAPEAGWDSQPSAFPVDRLPPHVESWNLTVWLSEPDHLPVPLRQRINLPRDGASTEAEFRFRPRALPRFEGRLTVLHRGRVLQTAILGAGVVTDPANAEVRNAAPRLRDDAVVRHDLGTLDRRRPYDLAFVVNHDSRSRPLLMALSPQAAWVKDLTPMAAIAAEINATLSPVAKSVDDYADGLDGEKGRALLVQLAQHGGALKAILNQTLEDPDNNPAAAAGEYIQIVSTRPDGVVPLEFVYDYVVPEDEAVVCPQWRNALAGQCPQPCPLASAHTVCPLGFWGLSKVIERHAVRPGLAHDGNVLYLQSEPRRGDETLYLGGAVVLGSSKRVPEDSVTALKSIIARRCGAEPAVAKCWDDWERLVTTLRPPLLLALAHTDGKNTNVTMEIGDGKDVKTITLRDTHVFPPPPTGHQAPLVALIGCDTAGTADDYGNHVLYLRDRGAGIVIGTIATVFGEHAATVAGKLVDALLADPEGEPVRLGELIRAIRRESLREGLLMPLCVVAFGDADWIISAKPSPHG